MDGIVTLLKPPGMTSSNAVYDVRRIFSEKRVGHTGTLDPGAAGVLPICIGRAAKLFDYLVEKEKTYRAEIAFGCSTDTQDSYGAVTAVSERRITQEALAAVLPSFCGTQKQTAPIYSALKVNGRSMYDLARAGEAVERREREINVSALEVVEQTGENRFLLEIRCSRGTYVRTLCEDIGHALGTEAYMAFLLRTASGMFTIDTAYTVAELEQRKAEDRLAETVCSCEDALSFLPALELPPDRRTPACNALETFVCHEHGPVRLYCGGFLGVGEVKDHSVRLRVHLY